MIKHGEKLKKHLLEISDVINAFDSEAVQIKIIDRVLDSFLEHERPESDKDVDAQEENNEPIEDNLDNNGDERVKVRKKAGATTILNRVIGTAFFDTPRSIANVAYHCKEHYQADFVTSELSGILARLVKENKLRRERNNENGRYIYLRA